MLANVGDELLGELAAGVELGEVTDDAAPDDLPAAFDLVRRRRFLPSVGGGGVQIQRVPERGYGLRHVPAQPLEPLLHRRRVLHRSGGGGSGGGGGRAFRCRALRSVVSPHQDLLHHVLVRTGSARPALQGRSHGRKGSQAKLS